MFANFRARGGRSKNLKNPDKYKDGLDRLDIHNKLVTMDAIPPKSIPVATSWKAN